MRRAIAIVMALLACLTSASAATPARKAELTSPEAILKWMYTYQAKPDLARVPSAVRAMGQLGLFKEPESSGVYLGFISGVLGSNPSKAEDLVIKMMPLAPEDQWVIVRAIAYSGLADWKTLMSKVASRMPSKKVMIDKYLAGELPTLDAIAFNDPSFKERLRSYFTVEKYIRSKSKREKVVLEPTPALLDTLWGHYFATGSYAPILRIIAMLPWSKEQDNIEKLTIGSMAKFTLATNAAREIKLLGMIKSAAQHQPKNVSPILKEVIDAAETFETARIRKEALAAVEELKRKGPGSKRTASLWGQVGEGAIAVGCIVAAATGHVELGLPCVVGGAVSSAALRFWTSQP